VNGPRAKANTSSSSTATGAIPTPRWLVTRRLAKAAPRLRAEAIVSYGERRGIFHSWGDL
jgi:hypothetical protein